MRLTNRSEYALLALSYLARCRSADCVTAETISQSQNIPLSFLVQILRWLRQARVVRSVKGQRGGYRLARAADQISIAEIVRLFDGALAPTQSVSKNFYQSTPIHKEAKMMALFTDIRDYVAQKLEGTSVADVA
jgi:Rrf2 family cysteine metabolism transcriptional repressor